MTQVAEMTLAKIAPAAIDLEQVVLGALIQDRNAMIIVSDILYKEAFYLERHQIIYNAINTIYQKSLPIDVMMLMEQLKKTGQLKKIGGPAYLTELTMRVASSANIEYHSRIIVQKYIRRTVGVISQQMYKEHNNETKDVFELLQQVGDDVYNIHSKFFTKQYSSMSDVAVQFIKQAEEVKLKGDKDGLPTGFIAYDSKLNGYHEGDLVIVAARPGMGKTSLALCEALHNAKAGNGVGVFSLEMSSLQLFSRMLSIEAEVNNTKIRRQEFDSIYESDTVSRTMESLSELPIYLDDTAAMSIEEMRVKARRMKANKDIKLIIVDYLQLLVTKEKKGNREQEVSYISRSLKQLAKELEIPIIALSQLSRAVETRGGTKRPILADLRESGSLEQDADVVKFLYRPEYYKIMEDEEGSSLKNVAEIIVAKNRHGDTCDIRVKFTGAFTKFTDFADATYEEIDEYSSIDDLAGDAREMDFREKARQNNIDNNIMVRQSKINDDEDIPY